MVYIITHVDSLASGVRHWVDMSQSQVGLLPSLIESGSFLYPFRLQMTKWRRWTDGWMMNAKLWFHELQLCLRMFVMKSKANNRELSLLWLLPINPEAKSASIFNRNLLRIFSSLLLTTSSMVFILYVTYLSFKFNTSLFDSVFCFTVIAGPGHVETTHSLLLTGAGLHLILCNCVGTVTAYF